MDHHADVGRGGSGAPNLILFMLAAMCDIMARITWNDFYTVLFNILSLTSVTLIIIINYPKAVRTIRNGRDKLKKKCP